jgi:hypothetical protein
MRHTAERWRGLVRDGSSGLDVSAARNGLEPVAPALSSPRWPDWIADDWESWQPHPTVPAAS